MDHDERELFARSLRDAAGRAGVEGSLDAVLADVGWYDAYPSDRRTATSLLFELQGAGPLRSSALDHVLLDALGRADEVSAGTVVLPALGGWAPPGRLTGSDLLVDGLATGSAADRDQVVVVAAAGSDEARAVVVPTAELEVSPVGGLDPSMGLARLRGEVVAARLEHAGDPVPWSEVVAAGQRALAHELLGGARAMLDLGVEHARSRVQFGQAIAGFQAVSHRLAEALVAIESADAVVAAAWDDPSPTTAALAKALAGRVGRTVARHAQQVLAGIGFTTEHPLHRYVRRTLVLDELLGSSRALTRQLGQQVIAARRPPVPPPL